MMLFVWTLILPDIVSCPLRAVGSGVIRTFPLELYSDLSPYAKQVLSTIASVLVVQSHFASVYI